MKKMWGVLMKRRHMAFAAVVVMVIVGISALSSPANAQQTQPSSVNPLGSAQSEQQLLDQARKIEGRGTLPDVLSHFVELPVGPLCVQVQDLFAPLVGAMPFVGMIGLGALF